VIGCLFILIFGMIDRPPIAMRNLMRNQLFKWKLRFCYVIFWG
jgi:hypothetical protein